MLSKLQLHTNEHPPISASHSGPNFLKAEHEENLLANQRTTNKNKWSSMLREDRKTGAAVIPANLRMNYWLAQQLPSGLAWNRKCRNFVRRTRESEVACLARRKDTSEARAAWKVERKMKDMNFSDKMKAPEPLLQSRMGWIGPFQIWHVRST